MLPGFRAGRHVANLDATKAARTTLKQSALFDLPVKVRKEIYRLCVPSGFVFDVREYNTFRGSPKISATPEALLDRSRWYFEGPSLDILTMNGTRMTKAVLARAVTKVKRTMSTPV
jgi:hypothetical protein